MEKKQGCKRRVIFLGFVAFSCSVAAEFEKAKAEDMKLDGSLCSLPRAPTFGLGVAAMVCQSVAQIMRTSAVGSRCALWVAGTQSWPSSSLSSHGKKSLLLIPSATHTPLSLCPSPSFSSTPQPILRLHPNPNPSPSPSPSSSCNPSSASTPVPPLELLLPPRHPPSPPPLTTPPPPGAI